MKLLDNHDQFANQNKAGAGVNVLRAQGVEFLNAKGLPTRKDEEWKYTNLKTLNEDSFAPVVGLTSVSDKALQLIQEKSPAGFTNIVFHNGVFDSKLSQVKNLPAGVRFEVVDIASAVEKFHDAFEALNAAYFSKCFELTIVPETSVAKPIHFLFVTTNSGGPAVMANYRIRISVGAGASVKFLESYYGSADAQYFVNSQTEVFVGESAKLTYVRAQSESHQAVNVGRTNFELSKFSNLHSLAFSTGAQLSRHNLVLELKATEATAIVDGLYVVRDEQHVDNTTVIDHIVGACTTSQHYKGILADTSRAVFNGKVSIQPNAQKANSEQLNNNLLLSRYAEADSKPQLAIYADDVKAAHGSTVGQLNREELFYLESRAIPPNIAIPMMSFGYVSELIYKLEDESLQTWLNQELRTAFSGLKLAGTV